MLGYADYQLSALNHALDAIRVNVVCPGFVGTEMLGDVWDVDQSESVREAIPMKVYFVAYYTYCSVS